MERTFLPGLELNRRFFAEVVSPLLAVELPGVRYSAGLLGTGSDVLGYDTARSMDHEWGPRLLVFLEPDDYARFAERIDRVLSERLPPRFLGFSTHFSPPDDEGVQVAAEPEGSIRHMVHLLTAESFFRGLPSSPWGGTATVAGWLLTPRQRLLEATAGELFRDDLGLATVRTQLAWYPPDVWRYLMAAQWQRIAQRDPFIGRTGELGDALGSRVVAATLVEDGMHLAFLIERTYPPYSKWFGTAFNRLRLANELTAPLHATLAATTWPEREAAFNVACSSLARAHNDLAVTDSLDTAVSPFHSRPFRVIHGERFAAALVASIRDPDVLAVVRSVGLIGGIDQISDNVDLLGRSDLPHLFRHLFGRDDPDRSRLVGG